MTIAELRAKLQALVTELKALSEKDTLTDDEQAAFEAKDKEARELKATIERRSRFDALNAGMEQSSHRPNLGQPGQDSNQEAARNAGKQPKHRFNILRAINSYIDNNGRVDGFEGEVTQELLKRARSGGVNHRGGIRIPFCHSDPFNERQEERAVSATTAAGVAPIVNYGQAEFIDILRASLVSQTLGCRVLLNCTGSRLDFPKQTASGTAYWISTADTGTVTASNLTVGVLSLTPNVVGCQQELYRSILNQSTIDAQAMVKQDMALVIAEALDTALINGSGSSGQPEGILNRTEIPTLAGGSALDWADIVGLEGRVAQSNANRGSLAYLTCPWGASQMKSTAKASNTAVFIMDPDGTVNGHPCVTSSLVPGTPGGTTNYGIIYGAWQDAVVAVWGDSGYELIIDPFTGAASGKVIVTQLVSADVGFRNDASFVKIVIGD